MNEIGYRVRSIRKSNGLSQVQFSETIGISQGNLSEIEIGHSNPSAETIISIGLKYQVNLDWLLLGSLGEDSLTYQNEIEKELLMVYRDLSDYDQKEILEIVLLKKKLRNNKLN
jgi:transcriptional regulator with XRE-family HTH domain